MAGDSSNTDLHRLDLHEIFKEKSFETDKNIAEDDVRENIYIYFSNARNLSLKCSELLNSLISCINKIIIRSEKIKLDLLSVLLNGAEAITDSYERKELKPIQFTMLRQPLFTEIQLGTKRDKRFIKTPVAYAEAENKAIGTQYLIYTTEPGATSNSSSSEDILENYDSELDSCGSISKRKRTCQKAGDFQLVSGHLTNSRFNNEVKCHVEILILIENKAMCKTLAKHLGLIFFEDLLEGEAQIERRLLREENQIYRLAHTEIIKKMMKGYSSICVTALESVLQFSSANVKGVIYTKNSKRRIESLREMVNYCVLVENDILSYIDAFSKIIQKYLLCNVSVGVNYELSENACVQICLPITVFIPLYIVKYFVQSFIVTQKHCQNSEVVDIFQSS